MYKWLPIIFGCHCKPERSFHVKGVQFPLCARCTGVLVGMILFLVCLPLGAAPLWVLGLLALPLVIDGTIQQRTSYESTNPRRFVTGVLFGYALTGLIGAFLLSGFQWGYRIGDGLR